MKVIVHTRKVSVHNRKTTSILYTVLKIVTKYCIDVQVLRYTPALDRHLINGHIYHR